MHMCVHTCERERERNKRDPCTTDKIETTCAVRTHELTYALILRTVNTWMPVYSLD